MNRVLGQRGIALIVISWLVILLSLWGVLFLREAAVQGAASGHAASRYRALLACESAVDRVAAYLQQEDNQSGPGQLQPWADNPDDLTQIEVDEKHFAAVLSYDVEKKELRYGLSDEASRLNLMVATKEQLIQIPGMTEEAAEAIIDWRDEDGETSGEGGAENEFYALLKRAYEPKNQEFETLGELLYVKGVDPLLLYGEDWNLNGRLDKNEDDGGQTRPDDDGNGELAPGIWRFLTLYSYEKDLDPDGEARVNINSAEAEELAPLLGKLTQEQLQRIPNSRPYSSIADLTKVNNISTDDLLKVIDYITVNKGEYQTGRVNVVTAPREVLLALDLDEEETEKLIAFRSDKTEGLDTLAWLITELGYDTFKKIANLVTVRSFQYRFQVQGWVEGGTAFARRWYVVDRSEDTFRILHQRDLHRYGPLRLPEK